METYAGPYPAVLAGAVNEMPVWQEYGWWLPLMVGSTYFLFMDVKLMLMMMKHEEKKKWKRYRLKNKFEE